MNMELLHDLEMDRASNAGILNVLRRKSAEILKQGKEGILLKDKISNVYMIYCKTDEMGIEWLKEAPEIKILQSSSQKICQWAKEEMNFINSMECYQFAYLKKHVVRKKELKLEIRRITKEELEIVQKNYDKLTKEELHEIYKRGNLYMGIFCGEKIGFIGNHLEGSIGLLEIFLKFRKHGFATDMENFMIDLSLKQGNIPYGQVITDNLASFQLQQKLGMQLANKKIYWNY